MKSVYLLIALLFVLAACQSDPALRTVPTSDYDASLNETAAIGPVVPMIVPQKNCANITCPINQTCKNGGCVCVSGKSCQGVCISLNSCCTDSECQSGSCVAHTCTKAPVCKYGEEVKDGTCGCAGDLRFCREQNKCISKDSCCYHANCDRLDRCAPTTWVTTVCAQSDGKKVCRGVADNNQAVPLPLNGTSLRIKIDKWLSDGSMELSVDNESMTLAVNQRVLVPGNFSIYQEGIKVIGGNCKEDNT